MTPEPLADLRSSLHHTRLIDPAWLPIALPSRYAARLAIRSVGRIQLVDVAAIEWLVAAGNYVELGVDGAPVLHRESLRSLELRLDPSMFARIHRSAIIRRTSVRDIRTTSHGAHVILCGTRTFRIGRKYRTALTQLLGQLGDPAAPQGTMTGPSRSSVTSPG